MLTPEEKSAIRKRAEAATEGPWSNPTKPFEHRIVDEAGAIIGIMGNARPCVDAEFIAHSRTDIPKLLDCVDELEKKVEDWKSQLADADRVSELVKAETDRFRHALELLRLFNEPVAAWFDEKLFPVVSAKITEPVGLIALDRPQTTEDMQKAGRYPSINRSNE